MAWVETQILTEDREVEPKLIDLKLDRALLLEVVDRANGAAADVTPFHALNAAGTMAYQTGTWGLRSLFIPLGLGWVVDRSDGVEAIRNDEIGVKVVFSNVDMACNSEVVPKPRTRKGSGSERACNGNLFPHLPTYAREESSPLSTYFLMVDETGAAELTKASVDDGVFKHFQERIFLREGSDDFDVDAMLADDDVVVEFDPQVIRR